uniref:Uncharacterized protein n=1 Tax=Glycine max TaxID=3847 RepID=K7LPR3_SOYBN
MDKQETPCLRRHIEHISIYKHSFGLDQYYRSPQSKNEGLSSNQVLRCYDWDTKLGAFCMSNHLHIMH